MSVRVALLDYGAGNLRSAQRGLERAGAEVTVTAEADVASAADALVVPGVGHFGSCMRGLRDAGLADLVVDAADADRPVLGICVGMQLLYESSEESDVAGLGVLPGRVVRLPDGVRVPHMGWNVLRAQRGDDLLDGVDGQRAYFVHSFHAEPEDASQVVASCEYGVEFPAIVRRRSVVATQFHPEKSAEVGATLLRNWVRSVGTRAAA